MYTQGNKGWLKHWDFILWDLACLHFAYILSYLLRYPGENPYTIPFVRVTSIFLILADVVLLFFNDTLRDVLRRSLKAEITITLRHVVILTLLFVLFLFLSQEAQSFSRFIFIFMSILYLALTLTVRMLVKNYLVQRKGVSERRLIVITSSGEAKEIVGNIMSESLQNFKLEGLVYVDKDAKGETIKGIPVVTTLDNIVEYCFHKWIDEIFICVGDEYSVPRDLMETLMQCGYIVHVSMGKSAGIAGRRQLIGKLCGYTVVTTSMNYATTRQVIFKRLMDIVGGIVGCAITGILFVFVAPAICIQSPGPVFFKQTRIGQNGKKFKMYKFRSMRVDAEEHKKELMDANRIKDGKMFKLDFDPRIIGNQILPDGTYKTGIGAFIRRTSIDEFPQFFNVLKGDMSLVGTRPPLPDEVELYEPRHRVRLAVKPGITGMWQVSGRSSITDFEEVVRLDTEYINEWSLGLDIKILLQTVKIVFTRKGSM